MAVIRSRGLMGFEMNRQQGIEWDFTDTRTVGQPYDRTFLLAEAAADGDVTLYDDASALCPPAPLDWLVVQVDPGALTGQGKSECLWVAVRITAGGNTAVVLVSRLAPLVLSNGLAGASGSLSTITGEVTKIEARNNNAAANPPPEGNRDILVRCFATN